MFLPSVGNSKCSCAFSEMPYIYDVEKKKDFGNHERKFYRTPRQSSLMSIKMG
jgi:hypothetical protein